MSRTESFHILTKKIKQNEIRDLIIISNILNVEARVIYISASLYYKFRNTYDEFSPIPLYSASIGLASKIADSPLKYTDVIQTICTYYNVKYDSEEHLEKSLDLECQICVENNFEIDCGDPYIILKKYVNKYNLSAMSIERTNTFLNDTIYLPYVAFFSVKKIVKACIELSILFDNSDVNLNSEEANKDVFFIMTQIIDAYSLYY